MNTVAHYYIISICFVFYSEVDGRRGEAKNIIFIRPDQTGLCHEQSDVCVPLLRNFGVRYWIVLWMRCLIRSGRTGHSTIIYNVN